ncbi:hypothetical protein OSTOST_23664, partial [Ostertagia ostertagi]
MNEYTCADDNEILEFVSSHFPMYDADLGKNQSFDEFCRGFCQANEPVRMFYLLFRKEGAIHKFRTGYELWKE